jgi:hypothetical protein
MPTTRGDGFDSNINSLDIKSLDMVETYDNDSPSIKIPVMGRDNLGQSAGCWKGSVPKLSPSDTFNNKSNNQLTCPSPHDHDHDH